MLLSCDKENRDEFATGTSENGIVGKWILVETASNDGTARSNKVDRNSKKYVVNFDSNGGVKSSDFPCSGKYIFDKNNAGSREGHTLSVSFDKCKSSETLWYSINGIADARIVNYNNLILNSENCDEPCTRVYRRLKD